jgi:hypothetical protein
MTVRSARAPRTTKQHLRKILGLLLRSTGAIAIIALDCFLMVWTGGELFTLVGEPLIAILPILGFGSLTFFVVQYLVRGSRPKSRSQSSLH